MQIYNKSIKIMIGGLIESTITRGLTDKSGRLLSILSRPKQDSSSDQQEAMEYTRITIYQGKHNKVQHCVNIVETKSQDKDLGIELLGSQTTLGHTKEVPQIFGSVNNKLQNLLLQGQGKYMHYHFSTNASNIILVGKQITIKAAQ